jgi:hypothetical protein
MKYHDLSGDEVKLDYPTLLNTAAIAFVEAREQVSRRLGELREFWHKNADGAKYASLGFTASLLLESAKDLEQAAYTLEALEGMKSRNQLKWLNKPTKKVYVYCAGDNSWLMDADKGLFTNDKRKAEAFDFDRVQGYMETGVYELVEV